MSRGKAKVDAKIRNAKKIEKMKRKGSEKDGQEKGKKFTCKVCMSQVHNLNSLKQHFESRHEKLQFNESDYI